MILKESLIVRTLLATCSLYLFTNLSVKAEESNPQEIRVKIKDSKSNQDTTSTLNGNISSFQSKTSRYLLKEKLKIIPGMTRTAPITGGVKSSIVKPDIYKAWLQKTHPKFALNANKFSPQSIVVVKGQWDNSARTLKKLGLKHKRVSGKQFNQVPLANTKVVIVDCEGELDRRSKQKLRNFVMRGGYLLSTDWDLDGFVSTTFPNYIVWNRGINTRLIYDATVVDADPVLFKNTVTNAPWKLDQESHLIRVLNDRKVRVLIKSRILAAEDPDRQGVLAVSFAFGRGSVLHMAGHFDNNSGIPIRHRLPDPAPVIQMSLRQALAINFIVAAMENRKIPIRILR